MWAGTTKIQACRGSLLCLGTGVVGYDLAIPRCLHPSTWTKYFCFAWTWNEYKREADNKENLSQAIDLWWHNCRVLPGLDQEDRRLVLPLWIRFAGQIKQKGMQLRLNGKKKKNYTNAMHCKSFVLQLHNFCTLSFCPSNNKLSFWCNPTAVLTFFDVVQDVCTVVAVCVCLCVCCENSFWLWLEPF